MKTFSIIIQWVLRLFVAFLLFQTSYYKLTANAAAIDLFTLLAMEPYGRLLIGLLELITAVLILLPRTTGIGALLSTALMAGALFFHFTKLGISINGDTTLFTMAILILAASAALIAWERKRLQHYFVKS
jgi:uncharacterized membrane protein YphA (DoxX/SURF4 family)